MAIFANILSMKEQPLPFVTYYEKQLEIAHRFTTIRKRRRISQKRLSLLSGVSYGSIRRFETSGDISLASLVKLALCLSRCDDLDQLFLEREEYASIEEVLHDQKN